MTQTSLKLIVPLPENDVTGFRRASLSRVCGGHDTIADVLNFFIYKASGVAQHLNVEEVDFVRIEHCPLDNITERVKVSKRTLHGYIKHLEAWGYLKAYPYHQTYDIYFQKITDALDNPPAPVPTKLRGRHTYRALSPEEQMLKLQSRYAELEEEMSKLTSQMSKLTFQKSKLTSPKSCEAASNQGIMGDFGEDRILESKESKEREEEQENEAPFSCSLSLSENAPSQEQVATRSEEQEQQQQQHQHNALPETSSEYKTDEQPESQNPFHVPTPEKKTPPAWIEHLPKVTSKQYKMPDRLFAQRSEKQEGQGQVPEPRPLTRNEQQYLKEQERAAIWKVIEDVFHTSFTYGVRTHISNTRGMDALIEDHFTPDDVKKALTSMEAFHRNNLKANFTLEKLHLKMPGLLAPKEEVVPPSKSVAAAHSSRPLDITPQPGGWGRRLDGVMMPGVGGRVRHD